MGDTETLVCSNCGGDDFSWIAKQVMFGTIQRFETGTITPVAEGTGDVMGDDIDEEGAYCQNCDELVDVDELEPEGER